MTEQNGFTLIELLAAMIAGALLLVGIGWATGQLGREVRASETGKLDQKVAAIEPVLRSLVASMLPPVAGRDGYDFSADQLLFEGAAPMAFGEAGRTAIGISRSNGVRGAQLRVRLAAIKTDAQKPLPIVADSVLLGGLKDIAISVRQGVSEAGETIPTGVAFDFVGEDGAKTGLFLPIFINSSGACRFDPVSMTCRR